MRYYPVCLDVKDRKCLVVGGGGVGKRKVRTLLECGAKVSVVSPKIDPELESLAETGRITLKKRPYQTPDLNGMFLVIGATDDENLNRRISNDAEKMNKLCNIADFPEACNFILPSIVNRGDLTIAVSTSGKSPAFARKLRKDLEQSYGTEYADFLLLMGAIRAKLLSREHAPEEHKPLFEQLIQARLLEKIRDGQTADINALLLDILGEGFIFEDLIKTG